MNEQNQSDEISKRKLIVKIEEWFDYLMSKWKIIFLVLHRRTFWIGLFFNSKPTYTASFLCTGRSGGGGGGVLSLANQFGFDLEQGGGVHRIFD
jgi:hypothetical protein